MGKWIFVGICRLLSYLVERRCTKYGFLVLIIEKEEKHKRKKGEGRGIHYFLSEKAGDRRFFLVQLSTLPSRLM